MSPKFQILKKQHLSFLKKIRRVKRIMSFLISEYLLQSVFQLDSEFGVETYPKSPERQAELFSALFENLLQSRKLHRKFFVPLMVECKDFFAHHFASAMELSTYEGLVNGIYVTRICEQSISFFFLRKIHCTTILNFGK